MLPVVLTWGKKRVKGTKPLEHLDKRWCLTYFLTREAFRHQQPSSAGNVSREIGILDTENVRTTIWQTPLTCQALDCIEATPAKFSQAISSAHLLASSPTSDIFPVTVLRASFLMYPKIPLPIIPHAFYPPHYLTPPFCFVFEKQPLFQLLSKELFYSMSSSLSSNTVRSLNIIRAACLYIVTQINSLSLCAVCRAYVFATKSLPPPEWAGAPDPAKGLPQRCLGCQHHLAPSPTHWPPNCFANWNPLKSRWHCCPHWRRGRVSLL